MERGGCLFAYKPVNEPAAAEWSAILGDIIDVLSEAFGLFSRRLCRESLWQFNQVKLPRSTFNGSFTIFGRISVDYTQ